MEIETPPSFTGHYEARTNRMWIDYTREMIEYLERMEDHGKCEAWYFDEDDQLKRIDTSLIGKTINGKPYEMPMPTHLTMQFDDPKNPLLLLLKLMLGAPPDPLPNAD